jgi:hypothetical protein
VCQDYLFHPEAAQRIKATLSAPRFMVTLRDPVERAFSSYLYMIKIGEHPGSFREALRSQPMLIDHGRYGSGLKRFADRFGRETTYLAMYDDLVDDPQRFITGLLTWLGLDVLELAPAQLSPRLPASRARSTVLARVVRDSAAWVREHDGAKIVGRVKQASVVQRLLYVPLGKKPAIAVADADFVRSQLDTEIASVEAQYNLDLRSRWGW